MIRERLANTPLLTPAELAAQCDALRQQAMREEYEREQTAALARYDAQTHARYRQKTFADFYFANDDEQQAQQRIVMANLQQYIRVFAQCEQRGINLILHGNAGTGKTLSANITGRALVQAGYTVLRTTSAQLLRDLDTPETAVSCRTNCENTPLLIIDEVSLFACQSWLKRYFFELIDARYTQLRPTVMITNNTPEEFITHMNEKSDRLGDKTWERLTEQAMVLHYPWASYRTETQEDTPCQS